nr:retrovirus-related Pol polyprotein from transposon TNT 1-94 [Tanacetum cinerariifolium]
MEILPESTSNSSAVGSDDGVTTSLQLSRNSRNPMLDHQDKYMMKAQVHVSKSSAISDIQALPRRKYFFYQVVKQVLRRRLLASFQDLEHEGGDTRIARRREIQGKSKHIDIRYHFINEHVKNGVIKLYFVNTEYQLAYLFTKALGREMIEFLINKLGMRSFTPKTLKQLTDKADE